MAGFVHMAGGMHCWERGHAWWRDAWLRVMHGWGACMARKGVCMAGRACIARGMHGWGACMARKGVCMAGRACIARGMHGWGSCMAGGHVWLGRGCASLGGHV